MKVTMIIITFCLIGAVFANPILQSVVSPSSKLNSNSTESASVSQSAENDTSETQSSEESTSNQTSESESVENTSEDTTSEESTSESDEDDGMNSLDETRDDSMGSEENVRKSWVQVFASVVKALSGEDNSSTEVKGHTENLTDQPAEKHNVETLGSDSTGDSSDTSGITNSGPGGSSSESTSSESNESKDSSDSSEDSDASESSELTQLTTKDCVNGTQSCESEEYFLQSVGDDAHFSLDNLMMPDEDERELNLRR